MDCDTIMGFARFCLIEVHAEDASTVTNVVVEFSEWSLW